MRKFNRYVTLMSKLYVDRDPQVGFFVSCVSMHTPPMALPSLALVPSNTKVDLWVDAWTGREFASIE